MALRLEITSKHRNALGERGVKEFGVNGGTIGRSLESDWVLPDPNRYLSSRHAAIDYRSGSFYVVDTSMNGVFVNEADKPVGRGKPQRLFSGDRLRIGDIEMRVHIDEETLENLHLTDEDHKDPVDLALRIEAPDPTTNDLVDPYEVTGVGIEELLDENAEASVFKKAAEQRASRLRLEETSDRQPKPAGRRAAETTPKAAPKSASTSDPGSKDFGLATLPQGAPARQPDARPVAAAPPRAAPDPATPARPAAAASVTPGNATAASGLLAAFFRGAGVTPRELSDKEAQLTLHLLGQIMREIIVGVREALHLRAEQKNVLRLAHTTIGPKDNNPLKFSAGIDEAMNNLLFRRASEYLPPVEAVREVFRDLGAHQNALLAAGIQALDEYMSRLEPDEIESKITGGTKPNALIGTANKLRYWDCYKDLYQVMAQHAPDQFPQAFLDEYSRAYEQRLAITGSPGKQRQKRSS